jgi:hypothetical protein
LIFSGFCPILILQGCKDFIEEIYKEDYKIKKEKNNNIVLIMNTLKVVDYNDIGPDLTVSIFYGLEYVKLQSPEFKKIYVDAYIVDCVHAYEGDDGMSCAIGAIERIIMSLDPACVAFMSVVDEKMNNPNYEEDIYENKEKQQEKKKYEEYKILVGIITANPTVLIPEYILDWYKEHNMTKYPGNDLVGTSEKEKEDHLIAYLNEKFPYDPESPEESESIKDLIESNVKTIKLAVGFEEEDSFTYGGRRPRTRKYKKGQKSIKSRKSNTRKHKKNKMTQSKRKNNERRKGKKTRK